MEEGLGRKEDPPLRGQGGFGKGSYPGCERKVTSSGVIASIFFGGGRERSRSPLQEDGGRRPSLRREREIKGKEARLLASKLGEKNLPLSSQTCPSERGKEGKGSRRRERKRGDSSHLVAASVGKHWKNGKKGEER